MKLKGRRQSKNVERRSDPRVGPAQGALKQAIALFEAQPGKRSRLPPKLEIGKASVAGMKKAGPKLRKKAAATQARYKPLGTEIEKPGATRETIARKAKAVMRTRKPHRATATKGLQKK